MRRLLLILLVFVLPLRAVAGDLMVLGMATTDAPAAAPAVPMAPDCEMHRTSAGTEQDAPAADPSQCCSLCLPVAQTPAFAALPRLDMAQAIPPSGDASFLSAPRARSFRPPSS